MTKQLSSADYASIHDFLEQQAGIRLGPGKEYLVVSRLGRLLQRFELPAEVECLDGGTSGMALIDDIGGREHLVVLDAVQTGDPPGTLVALRGGEVPVYFGVKVTPHQLGLSEVLAHLVEEFYEGNLEAALRKALKMAEGTYGIAVVHADEPRRIVGARNGSPLIVGLGDGEYLLAAALEELSGLAAEVPERARWLRTLTLEMAGLVVFTYALLDALEAREDRRGETVIPFALLGLPSPRR